MDLSLLQRVALDVAGARSVPDVLNGLVAGLESEPGVALARVWLRRPGGPCGNCVQAASCTDRSECLHLMASRGHSLDGTQTWAGLDGAFSRFPLGVRKVGAIGASGEAILKQVGEGDADWIADPQWMAREQIQCFAGQPLRFRDEILGVLAVFCRECLSIEDFAWLRTFADHAAVSIANARAFDEVESLRAQLELERDYLREEFDVARSHGDILGTGPAMQAVLRQIEMVAPTDAAVLIHGESGTGKELIATAIHEQSERSQRPMVRVNCASIPRDLFESEFFGHLRGSFTGALRDRAGRFQVADHGTLFLDEVGEIPLELQGKLLRVLQEGQLSPVGSDAVVEVDVRVIAATNKDLKAAVAEHTFREDLYYRLNVFPMELPPLRQRKQDIPELAGHFLRMTASRRNDRGLLLRKKDVAALQAYDWPGNIRELQNVIERAVILSSSDRLHIELEPATTRGSATTSRPTAGREAGEQVRTEVERTEDLRRDIRRALAAAGGRLSGTGGAADLLGIKPTTLASRMKTLGISRRG